MRVSLPRTKYKTDEQINAYYSQALERIGSLAGVEQAGLVTDLPIVGWTYGIQFELEGRAQAEASKRTFAHLQRITPDYFAAIGIPLLKGRSFTNQDTSTGQPVVIINETFARRYFAGEDPVGKRLEIDANPSISCEIVGVAGNVKVYGLGDNAPEENLEIYTPFAANPAADTFIAVRTTAPPMQMAGTVQREVQSLDKDQPITQVKSMDEIIGGTLSDERFNTMLIAVLAVVAVTLSAVGIYGIISFTVTQHTREIGIRMALGAQKRDVFKLILGQALVLVLSGTAIGLVAAFALTRLMSSMLSGVSATDTLTFASVTLLLISVAMLASYIPARRATRVDPMVALRYE
jgi:putative ABC transport system permease protein